MKRCLFLVGSILMLLTGSSGRESSKPDAPPQISSKVCVLKNKQTDYRLEQSVQILKDTLPGYSIQQITTPALQDNFIPLLEYDAPLENYQKYWS